MYSHFGFSNAISQISSQRFGEWKGGGGFPHRSIYTHIGEKNDQCQHVRHGTQTGSVRGWEDAVRTNPVDAVVRICELPFKNVRGRKATK
jgi:hypothetical protein